MRLLAAFSLCLWLIGTSLPQAQASTPVQPEHKLYLVTEPWPPFMGADLMNQGLMTEIVKTTLSRMHCPLALDFIPWARAIQRVKTKKADGLLGVYPTDERRQYLLFSDPIFIEQNALYAHRDRLVSVDSIDSLTPYSIGVVRDAANGPAFDQASKLNKVFVTTNTQSIEMLLLGRIDLLAGPERVIEHLLEQQFPEQKGALIRLTPILSRMALSIGIHRDYPEAGAFMQQFNRQLKQLKRDGSYDRIIKKHGVTLLTDERVLAQ